MCSGGPRKVTQPLAGVDTDPPSQPLALLSRCGLPPPRNSSFPAPSLSQLTQPELKEQMSVQSQNTGPASAKCGLTSTFLERSFLRSRTPRPSTEVLLTPQSRRRSWTSAEKGAHRPTVLLQKTLPPHGPCRGISLQQPSTWGLGNKQVSPRFWSSLNFSIH